MTATDEELHAKLQALMVAVDPLLVLRERQLATLLTQISEAPTEALRVALVTDASELRESISVLRGAVQQLRTLVKPGWAFPECSERRQIEALLDVVLPDIAAEFAAAAPLAGPERRH
jgi:hypothetical protein